MYRIVNKKELAPSYKLMEIEAPLVASKIKPGQFFVLRIDEKGERIPMTVSDFDREKGTITTVVHEVGKTTMKLGALNIGDAIMNVAGPLGKPSEIRKYGHVICICREGTAAAIYPIARALKRVGNRITTIIGARSKSFVILEDKLGEISDNLIIATDDGSRGRKGYAVHALKDLLQTQDADLVLAIGPTLLMKTASKIAKEHGIKATVSLGAIMLDGTGMCGACRVTVGGKTRFACIHGPEFDGYEVDFDELRRRQKMYVEEERISLQRYERGL
jgi:ferredoxin--NADP+ reductase